MDFETPCLVIDTQLIKSIISKMNTVGDVYFPVKANAYAPFLEYLAQMGCGFNVNCPQYLDAVLTCGAKLDKILYDNCLSSREDLDYAIEKGVTLFCVDSIEQYKYLSGKKSRARFYIKIVDYSINKSSKFGCALFEDLFQLINGSGKLKGISFYLGNDYATTNNFIRMVNKALSFGAIDNLNIGGGFDDIFDHLELIERLTLLKQMGMVKKIVLEPGRSLLTPAAVMYSRVVNAREINGIKQLRIDASIYSGLMDRFIEDKVYSISVHNTASSCADLCKYIVVGHTSDQADVFGEYMLNEGIQCGDILELHNCGSYSFDMSCNYSGCKKLSVRLK